ncbi:DUF4870 domain-containing protein [Luteipulveratus halotolerans]|uniref:DUF4870 domain-containing protein n=1 Tax=Luteipulveratus halotolerans TaxID=1631356 RepID=A0A0L6CI54_9MICO|nr:DUF4870 domain-containing protein [Luteipulveratus halotolerans]KNX37461.1 hypothetical protein VV01_10390 [Luteipulveratus halotolerans]
MSCPTPQPYGGQQPVMSNDDRTGAMLAHLSAPVAAVLSAGWLSMVGPLIVWFVYKDKSPAARHAAAGAFNFNLSFWVLYLISWILIFTVIGAVIGIPLLIVIFCVAAWCHIKGAVRASRGESYEYPWQLRVLA